MIFRGQPFFFLGDVQYILKHAWLHFFEVQMVFRQMFACEHHRLCLKIILCKHHTHTTTIFIYICMPTKEKRVQYIKLTIWDLRVYNYILYIYTYLYDLYDVYIPEPKWGPLFLLEKALFWGGLTFKQTPHWPHPQQLGPRGPRRKCHDS